jgi:aspartate/methionine/tyrosine aminotransferase
MRDMQTPVIPVVGELVRAHPGTISLGQGVVHYGPPPQALDSLAACMAEPENHKYKPVEGIRPLVQALETKLRKENGIPVGPGNAVVVTAGGNMAFVTAVLAVTDPGDEVILMLPYYFNHDMAIVMAGCVPIAVPTDNDYQLRPDAIADAITPKTRAVVTISPNNPTGAVYLETSLRRVSDICRERGVYHIHDEAYEYFTYGGKSHFSPGSISGSEGHTISLFSFSKSYGMASWRIGYMVIPGALLVSVKKILDTMLICPPVISQYAALGALDAGPAYARDQIRTIEEVRRMAVDSLAALGSVCRVPSADGAFYFLIKVETELDSMTLVERLVSDYGVAVLPGATFGMTDGCYLRVAYGALSKDTVAEGIGRLVKGLQAIR